MMNIDVTTNKIRSSFTAIQPQLQRVAEKKTPADKYTLSESKASHPIAQLGVPKYLHVALGKVQSVDIRVLRAQSVSSVLSRSTWINGMRFPKGTTVYYHYWYGKKKLWAVELVRNQVIRGIKCAPGQVAFNPNHRGRPDVRYVEKLSHDRYVKSCWGLIKCAKNTSLDINEYGQARGATLAKPLVLSKDLKLPIGSRVHLIMTPHYIAVTLGKKIRYKGLLLDKGDKIFFFGNKNRQVSRVYIRKPHVVKGVNCNVGRTIYYKLNGNVKSVKCHIYPKRQQGAGD